ncbi:hypothetical protein PMPD1_2509 [Paramixta manurensis]|uniref:Uncharacterized protein n=1 Tax=Paramixta manurensis TaxID=2740817 RepID=A0A6M8UEU4_9GAMM|nr:hypothetical protein PMPD1_2509 [Erwiniaceae bacterium PD-1]
MANCNCMNEFKEKLHSHLMQGVPEGSEIADLWGGTGWDNQVLSFGADGGVHVMLKYKLAYRAPKKNGELSKNFTRKECSLKMSYCPICGAKQGGDHV